MRKAASDLSLHHAVVSRHVNALEQWVGVALIDRESRSQRLTPEGERYHARISAAIAALTDATAELMQLDEPERLVIWSNGGFAAQWLGPRVISFNDAHPSLSLELRPTDQAPDLSQHEADVDIRFYGDAYSTPPVDTGTRTTEFARPPIMVVGASELAAAWKGKPAHAILKAPLLHEEHDEQWRAWFGAHGVIVSDPIPGARLWHAHIALDAAVQGKGFALASRFLVERELQDGRLTVVTPVDAGIPPPALGAYLLSTRRDRWNLPSLQQFRRWLRAQAQLTMALQSPPRSEHP
jgi:LysR family glycine cleavage system transcriptional activator